MANTNTDTSMANSNAANTSTANTSVANTSAANKNAQVLVELQGSQCNLYN